MGFREKLDRFCEKAEEALISLGIMTMAFVAIVNVIGRNLFSHSFSWVEEVTQFSIVIVTFVGTSYAARKGLHIRMSMLPDLLGELGGWGRHLRKGLALLSTLGTAAFMFYLVWYSGMYVKGLYSMNKYTLGLQIPVYLIMIWVPVGLASTGLQYLFTFLRNLTDAGVYISPSVRDGEAEGGYEV